MLKFIFKILILIGILSGSSSSMAGHFIKIENIDAITVFPKIKILVTINGINESLNMLDESNIAIVEDGSRLDDLIAVNKQNNSENLLYLVISVDSSKSISKKFLKRIKSSAKEIVRSVGSRDKIAVYRFNDNVVLLNDFSQSPDKIINNINSIERHGTKTLLYNSIYDSIELFDKVKELNKKVIVFTDGKDEGSSISDEDIIQFARNAMIPVYFICCKDSKNIRSMARISKLTGGKLIYSNSNDVCGMYRTVLSVMKNRYNLTYATQLKQDGESHKIEVRLKFKDIRDRDSATVHIEKKNILSAFLTNGNIIIGINILLLILLFAIIFYFIYREKKILKEKILFERCHNGIQTHDKDIYSSRNGNEEQLLAIGGIENKYAGAWVYQKNGSEIGRKFLFQSSEIIIGSDKENNIVINNDKSVSNTHSKIKNVNGLYTLYDLISDAGTYLNGKKLLRPKILHDWDEIKIGSTILIFRATQFINK